MNRRGIRLALIAAFVVAVFPCSGCKQEFDEKSFTAAWMTTIEHDTGLRFPEGTRGLNLLSVPPIDPAYFARIKLPESAYDDIAEQLSQFEPMSSDFNLSYEHPGVPWWQPENVELEVKYKPRENAIVHAMMCREDEQWILYLFHGIW